MSRVTATRRAAPARVADYIALTKPRIIELLLVTTVPAMVLASRDLPGMQVGNWALLTIWTLVGGSLAAGSANAINCYLDRDIDLLMARTRQSRGGDHAGLARVVEEAAGVDDRADIAEGLEGINLSGGLDLHRRRPWRHPAAEKLRLSPAILADVC